MPSFIAVLLPPERRPAKVSIFFACARYILEIEYDVNKVLTVASMCDNYTALVTSGVIVKPIILNGWVFITSSLSPIPSSSVAREGQTAVTAK